jgi:hypothetical protein
MSDFFKSSLDVAEYVAGHLEFQKKKFDVEINHNYSNMGTTGRHIDIIERDTGIKHHIKFALEPFHQFSKYFNTDEGKGETLDKEVLEKLKQGDFLYFGYPDKILFTTKEEFTRRKLWRKMKNGVEVCSYPIKSLEVMFGKKLVKKGLDKFAE